MSPDIRIEDFEVQICNEVLTSLPTLDNSALNNFQNNPNNIGFDLANIVVRQILK